MKVSCFTAGGRVAAAMLAGMLFGGSAASAQTVAELAAAARPMTAIELNALYTGKTWMWVDGAGHFGENRRFVATVGKGPATAIARGRWLTTAAGRMCFDADWRYRGGSESRRTCFLHRRNGEAIYQMREPSDEWFAFRGVPASSDDEFARLRDGDLVSPTLPALERMLAAPK